MSGFFSTPFIKLLIIVFYKITNLHCIIKLPKSLKFVCSKQQNSTTINGRHTPFAERMKNNTHQLFNPIFQQELFNSFAYKYDTLVNRFSFGISNKIRKELITALPINTSKINILDLMCGGGENWDFITHQFPNAT
ncbi:MAG: hypothetical protein RI955_1312, partial [Bacteroidota bacterium]